MPLKNTSSKKLQSSAGKLRRTPFVAPKRHQSRNVFSHSFVAFTTILIMISIEAFFGYPSRWFQFATVNNRDLPLYEEILVEGCTKEFNPVCGIDGKTYGNKCELETAKVTYAYKGECKIQSPSGSNSVPTSTGVVSSEVSVASPDILPPEATGTGSPLPYQTYKNTIFDYELSLPKYAYYRGYATKDKKGHTLAIDLKDELTANFDTALVRVTYTKLGDAIPIGAKVTFTLDKGTITVNYDESNQKVNEIIDAITSTAKSIDE